MKVAGFHLEFQSDSAWRLPWKTLVCLLLASIPLHPLVMAAQDSKPKTRFESVHIYVDSNAKPLAAYQLEFWVRNGDTKIVGIEGGSHAAFGEPPFYDPKALQNERVVIAAFSTRAENLPTNKTRVATVHLQLSGSHEPELAVKLTTAGTIKGKKITATASAERKEE